MLGLNKPQKLYALPLGESTNYLFHAIITLSVRINCNYRAVLPTATSIIMISDLV